MLDQALKDALEDAVLEAGQPKAVARRLTAWLLQMSQGESTEAEDIRFLSEIFDAIEIEEESED